MGDYYRIFGTMYGESGDYRRIDRGYIPCVAEVEFQIIEKFPGDFSGDEDTTFPGSDVLLMVVSEIFGCDMVYMVGGDSPSVRVLVPENHREKSFGGEDVYFFFLNEQLLETPFFEPGEFFFREIGSYNDVCQ